MGSNPNPNGLGVFFIKGNSVLSNGPRNLPRNALNFTILDSWVLDNLY